MIISPRQNRRFDGSGHDMKKLPLGIQTFSQIIREGYLYVDKTAYLHRLITRGKFYFLSRPRRFGKSVLISTLASLFRGERDLFRGLHIEEHWAFAPHLVIRLDMLGIPSNSLVDLERGLKQRLDEIAARHDLVLTREQAANRFRELIVTLGARGPVVVLVDEYDKPILDQIGDPPRAEANRQFMATFYGVIKSTESYLAFTFLTGVSKFAKISLFSDLNNLQDLTLNPDYAGIAGYTESEVNHYLRDHLTSEIDGLEGEALRAEMRSWYNGYSWDGKTRVYNPISVLSMLNERRFEPFWFATGTPKFLIALLRQGNLKIPDLEHAEIHGALFESVTPDNIDALTLFFQTGYLTIREAVRSPRGTIYRLGYPNREVKDALLTVLLADYASRQPGQLDSEAWRMGQACG